MKIIDPISLDPVAGAWFPERCSYGRMAMAAVKTIDEDDEDVIALVGDENMYQYRWNPRKKKIYVIPKWTRQYRTFGDGSFPGTGPAIYENKLYFTDNTFPVYLKDGTFSAFAMPLLHLKEHNDSSVMSWDDCFKAADVIDKEDDEMHDNFLAKCQADSKFMIGPEHYEEATIKPHPKPRYTWDGFMARWSYGREGYPSLKARVKLTKSDNIPGFFFWSAVINPLEESFLIWDMGGTNVQCRHMSTMELNWEISGIAQSDCLNVAADKGHVYLADYDTQPSHPNRWLSAVGRGILTTAQKYFIVADSSTGKILLNTTVGDKDGYMVSVIVGGANNDVFVSTYSHLTRFYVPYVIDPNK